MNLLGQKITLRRILGMIAGVVIIGIGIAVFKFSRLGNDSISALNLRLAELVGLPFSIENVLMNLCLFVPQLLWGRRYIGLGTIINSFCIGFIVTFTGDAGRLPAGRCRRCRCSCFGSLWRCWSSRWGARCTRRRI